MLGLLSRGESLVILDPYSGIREVFTGIYERIKRLLEKLADDVWGLSMDEKGETANVSKDQE